MLRSWRRIVLVAVVCGGLVGTLSPAQALELPSRTTVAAYAAVFGTLYLVGLVGSQAAIQVIRVTVPGPWVMTTITFGVPAVMVGIMSQAVPHAVATIPPTVVGWMNGTGRSDGMRQ